MAEGRTTLLSGLKSFFVEEEGAVQVPKAKSIPPVAINMAPIAIQTNNGGLSGPTEAELKEAEGLIAQWSNFRTLDHLKKFSEIEARLRSKISDPVALRAAVFEMIEVAGLESKLVVEQAKTAVNNVLAGLSVEEKSIITLLQDFDTMEKNRRENLEGEKAAIEKRLAQINTELSTLSDEIASKKETTRRKFEISKNVAGLFVEQWSPVGK